MGYGWMRLSCMAKVTTTGAGEAGGGDWVDVDGVDGVDLGLVVWLFVDSFSCFGWTGYLIFDILRGSVRCACKKKVPTYHRYKIRLLNSRNNIKNIRETTPIKKENRVKREYCFAPLLGMYFDDFRSSIFDFYVEGLGINKQVLVTFFRPLRIWTTPCLK